MKLSEKKILVITGKAGAGKDTLARMIREFIYGTKPENSLRDFKFSGPLKDAFCLIFGWQRSLIDTLEYKQERLEVPFTAYSGEQCQDLWTRREIMQYLGTDVFRAGQHDIWVKAAIHQAANVAPYADGFISTDCRFPNELAALRENFGAVHTIDLVKVNGEQLDGRMAMHASEAGPYGLEPHEATYVEAGDFEALRRRARNLALRVFPELCGDTNGR